MLCFETAVLRLTQQTEFRPKDTANLSLRHGARASKRLHYLERYSSASSNHKPFIPFVFFEIGIGPMQTLPSGVVDTPTRQSCDRCHGQKLRCPRPSNGNSGACERCIRSKAQCVYSSSLPKGRPSLYRQIRQKTNAANPKSSLGSDKDISGGTNLGVDNNRHSAIVTEMITVEEQYLNQTTTAAWDNPMTMDWMEFIDNTFPESEQWQPESQNVRDSL